MDETGYVRIAVTEANGTIPVEGAFVTVRDYAKDGEGDVLWALTTDADGLTGTVPLTVPPAGDSLSPGSDTPGGLFSIRVTAEGFYPVEIVGVPGRSSRPAGIYFTRPRGPNPCCPAV